MKGLRNLFLLLVVLSVPASASGLSVPGEGRETCNAWTSSAGTSSERRESMRAWVTEFVSAHAAKKSIDARGLFDWIDAFCRANPTALIRTAAELYTEQHFPDPDHPLVQ